jgi:hypothetical protein
MSEVRNRPVTVRDDIHEVSQRRRATDNDVRELLRTMAKDKTRAADLARVEVKALSGETQQALGRFVARELRGQLPAALAQAVAQAKVGTEMLQTLTLRLANAYGGGETQARLPQATTPDAARAQASDGAMPQQALRWTQFVQRTTHVPAGHLHDRAGSAVPKGEMATLTELLGQRRPDVTAAGLRTPKLVERALAELSPGQRAMLMQVSFGDKLAGQLTALGIHDPLGLVRAGALPQDRAALAAELGIDRGKLLALLLRTEMLKIGPGRNGELGMRPALLGPLHKSGIAMLGTMAALRSLRGGELSIIHKLLHQAASGFSEAMKGSHIPAKRDLLHWAQSAARRPSEILLADADELAAGNLSRADAQELITAWYLENLFWEALAGRHRIDAENERRRQQRQEQELQEQREETASRDDADHERRHREQSDAQDQDERDRRHDEDERQREREDETFADLEYDHGRDDRLMCFWITDFNTAPGIAGSMRRMYVCVDPATGAIIPQRVEADILPSHPH